MELSVLSRFLGSMHPDAERGIWDNGERGRGLRRGLVLVFLLGAEPCRHGGKESRAGKRGLLRAQHAHLEESPVVISSTTQAHNLEVQLEALCAPGFYYCETMHAVP